MICTGHIYVATDDGGDFLPEQIGPVQFQFLFILQKN